MSHQSQFRDTREAIWASDIPTNPKIVALSLVEYLPNPCPSVETLMANTGLCERSVRRAIKELINHGVLEVQYRIGSTSVYRFAGHSHPRWYWEGALDAPLSHETPGGARQTGPGPAPVAPKADNTKAGSEAVPASLPKPRRKRPLPDDFKPNESHAKKAAELGVNQASQLEVFKDYWKGEGGLKVDWDATFMNWLRRSAEFKRQGKTPTRPTEEEIIRYVR